ncbi:MAG: permease-like cell division protein FtsX [Pseudomonadota bacterium]|nr:permease-like cell division protein FtsX [Pseudomonadota bacterium]
MSAWLNQHLHALQIAGRRLFAHPISSLFTILVIGLVASLPAFACLVVNNIASLAGKLDPEPKLSVYLKTTASEPEVAALKERLSATANIANSRFVSKDAALAELESAGIADVAKTLEQNPLPHAFVITPKLIESVALNDLKQTIQSWAEVDVVELDSDWARKLSAFVEFGKRAVFFLTLVLGLALIFVMANTVRLQILNQREEIEVSRLIGATPSFVRRPFLYFGIMQAALGGLLALGLVALGIYGLNQATAPLVKLYAGEFYFRNPDMNLGAMMILGLVVLAMISAGLAVRRTLRSMAR